MDELRDARLVISIIGMLIVAVAFVSLSDQILEFPPYVNDEPVTPVRLFGWFFAPVAWLMGISDRSEATIAGTIAACMTGTGGGML